MTTFNNHNSTPLSDAELLRHAISDAETRPATRNFELSQLYSGFVRGREDLEALWLELTAQTHARADFHVEGDEIREHSIPAETALSLIKGVVDATMKTANHRLRKIRKNAKETNTSHRRASGGRPLLLTPFRPGSFEFSVETQPIPPAKDASEGQIELDDGRAVGSIDDLALLDVVDVLYSAGEHSSLQKLPHSAQQSLLPAAKVLTEGGFQISVRVTQRNRQPIRRTADHSTATQLVERLEAPRSRSIVGRAVFRFDGYRESDQAVFLLIKEKSQRFTLEAPSLLSEIRALLTAKGKIWLECAYVITVTSAAGKNTETDFKLIHIARTKSPSAHRLESDERQFRELVEELRAEISDLESH